MATAKLSLDEGLRATVQLGKHTIIVDEPVSDGGTDLGPGASELILAALGACAAITAKMYAARKRWPLEGVEIDLNMDKLKAADYPAYAGTADFVNEFRQCITFKGPLTQEQRERLLQIAGKCPVHRLLTAPNFLFEELVLPDEIEAGEG
jgi:putative redox protein